jgi:cytochrome c-type biogenesis protein CcmH/NrfG
MARRPARATRGSSSAFVLLAIVVVGLLVLGSIAAVFTTTSDGSDDDTGEDPAVVITPGEEISRLETAVTANPQDVDSLIVLAEVLANSGRVQESVPWYERAVALRPDDIPLRNAFGRALQRNRSYFDAEVQYKQALTIDPNDQEAAYYLADLYESMPTPRTADAREWYQRAIDADPDSLFADQARQRLVDLGGEDASPTSGAKSTP